MAKTIAPNDADIVGLNEFKANWDSLVRELNSRSTTRHYQLQPGLGGGKGYGTDILFDDTRWDLIDGGKDAVYCHGQRGGHRGLNWVVLSEKATGLRIVAAGIHLTYCHYKTAYG